MAALSTSPAPAFLADEAEAPAFLQREAALAEGPPLPADKPTPPAQPDAQVAAKPANDVLADDAKAVPEFLKDEALVGALAVDTPRTGDPVGRAKRVTSLLDAAAESAEAKSPQNVPRYYQDRAALLAELEKADDDVAPLPFLRRAPRDQARAPIQPAPDLLVAEARRDAEPVAPFLRQEADRAAQRVTVPGTGQTPETRVAVRSGAHEPATTQTRDYRETTSGRRAVDAGVAAYLGRDYEKALGFWRPAAERGNPDAQFFLGGLYLDGNGVTRNLITAHVWFARAAQRGHARATEQLALLRKIMTQDQYAAAERRRAAD